MVAEARNGRAVDLGALTAHRGELLPGRGVDDQRAEGTVGVQGAERDPPVGDPPRAVRGSVDRVDDHGDRSVRGARPSGFLADDRDRGPVQDVEDGGVGDEVERVLARSGGSGPQLGRVQGGERDALRVRGGDEEVEEVGGAHGPGSLADCLAAQRAGTTSTGAV